MQQAPPPPQNKGTLLPGQTISVNKYAVQVERYLSQGGFSHVYLVRTATPVYNTTHHVLKRIAVPNETMLTEVKKEVDIMRILKGHPNVVHLIDAAWHRMSSGQYEVFILMEFCPGGGIIDMMNRRLRERLTEAEILQIFVDVLEGVAAMHNLRPALLHRDLKVENILQSSSTSFKLCDFGSATPVTPRPPSTTQEIRALEADLNRHTTLQYRSPEMVDPYSRRPIDEKSDVWALGVLLYKLCYYTTPFEEHGPLAILNVQYRIPPYPVYSAQLNGVIASMLREHGTQRPSVFELLAQVHRMRGTKSRFTYNVAPPQPLSPRTIQSHSANSLDNLVSYRASPSTAAQQSSQAKGTSVGIQAREKVLEAIAPMRRGRPSSSQQHESVPSATSRPPSPPKGPPLPAKPAKSDLLSNQSGVEEDKAWKTTRSSVPNTGDVKVHRSGGATTSAWRVKDVALSRGAWSVESLTSNVTDGDARLPSAAFGDNFAEKLWNAYDGAKTGSAVTPATKPTPPKIAPPLEGSRTTKLVLTKGKDAFDGLGLASSTTPAPTLGEARKLRTGLAAVNAYSRAAITPGPPFAVAKPSSSSVRPSPSPRPSLPHTSSSWKFPPAVQPVSSSTSSGPPVLVQLGDIYAEARFPSLEELDATFATSQNSPRYTPQPEPSLGKDKVIDLSVPSTSSLPLRPTPQRLFAGSSAAQGGIRSEQVTGVAMRDTKTGLTKASAGLENGEAISPSKRPGYRSLSRPSSSKKHASSASKQSQEYPDLIGVTGDAQSISLTPQKTREPKDWLTGDVDSLISPLKDHDLSDANPPETPVLREFTHKRSSFVEENKVRIQSPQEAIAGLQSPQQATQEPTPPSPTKKPPRSSRSKERKRSMSTVTSNHYKEPFFPSRFPPGPLVRAADLPQTSAAGSVTRPPAGRSSSSENWKAPPTLESPREGKMSSSDEDSPEDVVAFMASRSAAKGPARRHKGRQSSVHELVDLWGGGVVQTKERRKDSTSSTSIDPPGDFGSELHRSRSVAAPSTMYPRASSPQQIQPRVIEVPRSPSRSPNRRSPKSHTKQMSAVTPGSAVSMPASRGRPQSLLMFPMSKSVSDGKQDTPSTPSGLSVPEDGTRKNGSRRTSITDMVQRYEAIGKVAGPGPPTLSKPGGLKVTTTGAASTAVGRPSLQPANSPITSKFTSSRFVPASEDPASGVQTDKRQSPTIPRTSFTGQADKSADLLRNHSSLTGLPTSSPSKMLFPGASQGPFDGLPPLPTGSAAKVIAPPEEDLRTPSPDKPYRGVGKLIDQWQKKSEEAHGPPVPRRGFAPKRAGLVTGSVSRNS
ncbi:hypothetical protein PAXRUDRAFT_8860 [Paxillus rubicundulus Ve08.2h10]|uniref:non-specific serine/threonine protein kinase n=1 Tax=Paxillus rubicundulus Ve08.2h10 TaxID=930991 RepID=A0A0D0DLK3_9AGAM|nr:hypothetical protein PAXRUDRAFT_8860 [Paxillus rubicundulus Ve08.2h10]